jgi:hypothetical protein
MKAILFCLGRPATLMLISTAVLLGQEPEQLLPPPVADQSDVAEPEPVAAAPTANADSEYIPLTLKKKYLYSIEQIFGPSHLVGHALHAAMDQLNVRPVEWGNRPDSLAIRFASGFGTSFLKHNIEFGVGAIDHEDPRYFRLGHGRPWTRIGYAVYHTFVVHNDRGGWMPAYSLAAADIGTPYLVRMWRPERFQTAPVLEAGALSIGADMGANILREFWPDMKKVLPAWIAHSRWLAGHN